MQPVRFSINVTLDGCCDHRESVADEDLHRHAIENLARNDALLFARTIDAAKKYVVSRSAGEAVPTDDRLRRTRFARG